MDGGDSDVEFQSDGDDDSSFVPPSETSRKSLQGDALRNLRKQMDYSMSFNASTLPESNQQNQPTPPPLPQMNSDRLLTLDEGLIFAIRKLNKIGFENSKSQRSTGKDGNNIFELNFI